jgi:uncharacterized protein
VSSSAGRLRVNRLASSVGALLDEGGTPVLDRCYRTQSLLGRTVGLLRTPDLEPGEGLWIAPCGSVHTIGMKIAIDVAFLDPDGRVVRVVSGLPPGRFASARGARSAVEATAGAFARLRTGERLELRSSQ